ncbi:MAG: C4-type zinc ribbon domain-containing protein [Bacteroidetes bacterium]|nr:C4-type zinc ribbon domain-containing protein [Bacteroidota bacterium]
MATKAKTGNIVEDKLNALWDLQSLDSEIDKIRQVRGELPLEVQDLEDEVAGLETRLSKLEEESQQYEEAITARKNAIKDSKAAIKKYTEQQNSVRNNREFESLNKEIEYQNLEIQLSEKKMKELAASMDAKKEVEEEVKERYSERTKHLKAKKKELDDIVKETEKEESSLLKKSKAAEALIEPRLLNAYNRLRGSARNGLAVVKVERDSCGGCFNKIPPQRQLDIKTYKKIIVCEHCGRILVDKEETEA